MNNQGQPIRIRQPFPDEYATAYDLQGRSVGVASPSGLIKIKWLRENGESVDVNLTVKLALAATGSEYQARALDFTPVGIDIVDSAGQPFRKVSQGGRTTATVTKEALPGTQDGPLAVALWRAVLGAHGIEVPGDAPAGDVKQWGKAGVKYLSHVAVGEKPEQNRPLQENDGLYPLMVFLDERFPSGGVFRTVPKSRNPTSTEDLQAFVEFLQTPEWAEHPYSAKWRVDLTHDPPDVALFGKNLPILRSCEMKRTATYPAALAHLPKKERLVNETFYHIGAPGTGSIEQPYAAPPPRQRKTKDQAGAAESTSAQAEEEASGTKKSKKAGHQPQKKGKVHTSTEIGIVLTKPSDKGKKRRRESDGAGEDDTAGDGATMALQEEPVAKKKRGRPRKEAKEVPVEAAPATQDEPVVEKKKIGRRKARVAEDE